MLNRYRGALIGLAVGDALGTTLEFTRRGTFEPITDMIGGGPFRLKPGEWTDDTSMAMCLAESLLEKGFDARDQMERYLRWWRHGYWSSTGRCFDIGQTVLTALARFSSTGEPFAGSNDAHTAGNGSLMRLAPAILRYAGDPSEAIRRAADSSRTTHGATEAVDACRYFAFLMCGALSGEAKDSLLEERYGEHVNRLTGAPLAPSVAAVAAGSFKSKTVDGISASGYVMHTLEAALWAFHHSESFRDGLLMAVNLGEDADTTGAVFGQLAGAFYGIDNIPAEWRSKIARADDIDDLARRLFAVAGLGRLEVREVPKPR